MRSLVDGLWSQDQTLKGNGLTGEKETQKMSGDQ
jgi:hypothetical protein